ncbi:MAG: hypothetical protein ACYCV6_01225 [Steroidobacteraceae bacterium]
MFVANIDTGNETDVPADLASCYVEDDTVETNEQTERDTRRMQQNWVSLGNGGFFTRPAMLSDFA